ncbi:hypothetical protein TetV_529 [Tetraselmis virus 1]|uniref:Uncharacterized protein n=1 Tax=Tetraselmis virus 1 TaxID=2060617 RepID=A0A2P0VNZ2_9VIRU|nr:hypothetical protein QJ968_gp525 [Tetraselmis virus 1]AUF82611.1 hypothetical protein TetV_529 [Tetraselmis virus 1]
MISTIKLNLLYRILRPYMQTMDKGEEQEFRNEIEKLFGYDLDKAKQKRILQKDKQAALDDFSSLTI